MPKEVLNEQQVAMYLHMDIREVVKLASRGQIPCRKVGGGFQFRMGELDHWVEAQMHTLGKDRLAGIARGVSAHHGFDVGSLTVSPMIPQAGLAVPLLARTRDAAIRAMVDLADKAELVYGRDDLIQEVRAREELCSTGLMRSVAFPHPRHPLPYDIAASFVVVGLTGAGIPYGAPDGSLTRLFFLICCKDDRTHLHVLARLALMLHDNTVVERLLEAADPDALRQLLLDREQAVVAHESE